jgi:hypothetical protein
MSSVLIRGGTVVNAETSIRADVLTDGGLIRAVGPDLQAPAGATIVDAGGALVMPGGIDPHTHMELPFMGTVTKDDFYTGTAAGVSGGTTMIIDFVIPNPKQPLMEAFADWDKRAKDAVADYSYHMCITYWDDSVRKDMAKVVAAGVTTFGCWSAARLKLASFLLLDAAVLIPVGFFLGGIGHTLPFMIPSFSLATAVAIVVVMVELGIISWIRHRYMESPPLFGGTTYFQNIPLLALLLAKTDHEAFDSLFLPDAITIVRPRGKGAIKVTTPVLFVNDCRRPQSFYRVPSGEYSVSWRRHEPLLRAKAFLDKHSEPFSLGSFFLNFPAPGHGCLINNQLIAHARTGFRDDPDRKLIRLLSRKWFMRSPRDSVYKLVPGMFITERFADAYADVCRPELLEGEWLYDQITDCNRRMK